MNADILRQQQEHNAAQIPRQRRAEPRPERIEWRGHSESGLITGLIVGVLIGVVLFLIVGIIFYTSVGLGGLWIVVPLALSFIVGCVARLHRRR